MGRENITDDEAREALDRAKSNETLFKKQASAIRNEYKTIEDENRQYELYLELENLIKECKEQNGGKPCLPYSIHLKRQLICFNPSYDNVVEELSKLKGMEEESR